MLKIGDRIMVGDITYKQRNDYSLISDLIGLEGKIEDIKHNRYYVKFFRLGIWWFPIKENIIFPININKWNPLGYKSHFKPVKLP